VVSIRGVVRGSQLIVSCRTKQYYQFIQKEWIEGDDGQPPPPPERKWVRNKVSTSVVCHRRVADSGLSRNGNTCTSTTFCPCPTSGNTLGSQRRSSRRMFGSALIPTSPAGTPLSTVSRSP
jgi:hypothetical protein